MRRFVQRFGFVAAGLLGCVSYGVIPTARKGGTGAEGARDVSFEVVSKEPTGSFDEVATVTVNSATTSPEKFRSAVKEDVCRVGGDVVVTEVNGLGPIVRGVVLRRN